jgi:hypothetical protein
MSSMTQINDATGFAEGDKFTSEQEVRQYFSVSVQVDIFGDDAERDIATLNDWAETVIENRWHCQF